MSFRASTVVVALTLAAGSARADTSATLSTAISLPKGPASIEGFGQGYDVSPASGLPSLTYPIDVPPGRAGLQPELALHYNAGEGAGALGLGWSLGLPALERSLRTGIPRYDGSDAWVLRGLGGGEELVEVGPGVYRERIEQGPPVFVRALPGGAMSVVTTDGTGYLFGLTADARLSVDAHDFRLELSAITDVHGNRLDFHYIRAPGSTAPLLTAITYNDGRAAVRFEYEKRPDLVRTRAPGFLVELRHRLRSVATEVDGAPVRTTTLTYARSVLTPASVLARIDTVAADGTALPTWHLDYTRAFEEPRALEVAHAPALDPTADGRAWLDLDGDALPDLLDATGDVWRYRKGRGSSLAPTWTEFPAPAVALTKTARFTDLTGDGAVDLLAQPGVGELWAFTGGDTPFGTATPITIDLGFDLTAPNVALVDLNLDTRVDVLRHDDADGWSWLRRHDTDGYLPAEPVPPPPTGMRLGDPGVQLVDLDGDRLPDLVRVLPSEGRVLFAAGEGLGMFAEPVDLAGVPAMQASERWEFADLNSDGAADLVRLGGSSLDVYINQNDGSVALAANIAWPALEADEVVILSDVDASGTADILRIDTDGSQPWRVWLLADRPGLLARLRTGLGYTRDFTYAPAAALAAADAEAGDPWTTTPPTPLPVLTWSHETDAHTPWSNTIERHVRDGWYDPERGEFRGFAELRETRAGDEFSEPATVTTRFDLGQSDEARKLQLLTTETASPRGVLVREEHTLAVESPAPGVRAVRRAATDTLHVEAGPEAAAAHVRTEWDYDEWGNVLEERSPGRVDLAGDERTTLNVYAEPRNDDGPRDRLAEQIVEDGNGLQITATRTYYDGEPEQGLPLGEVDARGVVVRIETWLADDTWIPTLRQAVDAHGNVTRLRDAEDGLMTRRYDDLGFFPVEEHLHLDDGTSLVTTATWDARNGLPRAVTSPNGATTSFLFDGLGRLTAEIEPGDTPELPTRSYRYHLDGRVRPAVVTELRRQSGAPDVERLTQHLDGLGRPLARVTADDTGAAAIIAEALTYTSTGAVARRFTAVSADRGALEPGAVLPELTTAHERLTYDALGRVTTRHDPDGRDTAFTYGPLWTDRRDHEDLHPEPPYTDAPTRTHHDGLGHITAIEHLLAGRVISHAYAHDPASRITSHTDPAGHITRYSHDGASRLVAIDSPDAGHITQRFDAAGRLVERITATGARITWTYDRAGRLVHELALHPDGTKARESTRTYDSSIDPGARFERGQLTAAEDDAGRLELVHDARGRIVRTTRRFAAHAGPVSLSTTLEYDAQGRPLREVYPDGTALERAYTARGLESPLAGWLDAATYDEKARWTSLTLPNDVSLARQLDHTGRTLRERVSRGTSILRDLTHRYDGAGQLAQTRDLVGPTATSPALDAAYQYDDLRRLTRAEQLGQLQRFTYTADDNFDIFAGAPFTYDPDHPHAVTEAHGQQLTYDAAGQLARVTGDGPLSPGTWRFDPHGRLQTFTADDGRRTEHVYDHAGHETIRREYTAAGDLAHETLYFGDHAEARDGRLVRWIFWSGERIAESPTGLPRGGYPASALGLAAVFFALVLARRARQLAPLVTVLAVCLSILNCHGDPGSGALVPDAATRFHITDRLGSAALVLDHRGELAARDAHTAHGAPHLTWRKDRADAPTYRFTGKEDHVLAGAVTIGARHYLPALGRWASPDPHFLYNPADNLADPGERNLYRYAANNPINAIDPTGHGWVTFVIKVVKGTAKGIARGVDKVDEFSGIADDVATIASAEAGIGARVLSALSLASEALPISAGDLKGAYRWARGGDKLLDAASAAKKREALATFEQIKQGKYQKGLPEQAGPVGHLSQSDVRGRTPAEIDARAKQLGLLPRGPDPKNGRGAYIDPQTKKQRILSHPNDKVSGPHGHVNNPLEQRIGPDGNVVGEATAEAHIPIKTQ